MDKYQDIINLKHFDPKYHPRMTMSKRAMQFAPFAALTSFDDYLADARDVSIAKTNLSEDQKEQINKILQSLCGKEKDFEVQITYYCYNMKNNKGRYQTYQGKIKKIDLDNRLIKCQNNQIILLDNIIKITKQIS